MIIGFMNGISFLLFLSDNKKNNKTGWGGRIRTCECRLQKPMPYRLATPQSFKIDTLLMLNLEDINYLPTYISFLFLIEQ